MHRVDKADTGGGTSRPRDPAHDALLEEVCPGYIYIYIYR